MWLTAFEVSPLFGWQHVVILQPTPLALSALVYDALPRVAIFAMDIAVAIDPTAIRRF